MTKHIYCDVVIAGCGAAGLYTALNLPKDLYVLMICKEDMDTCDSMLAQGGICVLRGEDDYESYFEDTMRAGHYENRKESVDLMIRTSPGIIRHLLELGVGFDKNPDGSLKYTKEGAHSRPRICFHEDITGKAITTVLQEQTAALPNVNIMEYTVMTDILTANGACAGILARTGDGSTLSIHVQIHPTSLYTEKPGRSFLISESARGEGAVLLNGKGERFVNELLPRDAVSQAIEAEMEKEGSRHVWLSFAPMPRETIREHFPHIYETCLEEGYDITREPIPVVPAQHYFMGGVWVDLDSRTTMEHLYAVGETSCNGVHGKNRLASNSLLESLVFAGKAAKRIENSQKGRINYESNYHAACC